MLRLSFRQIAGQTEMDKKQMFTWLIGRLTGWLSDQLIDWEFAAAWNCQNEREIYATASGNHRKCISTLKSSV